MSDEQKSAKNAPSSHRSEVRDSKSSSQTVEHRDAKSSSGQTVKYWYPYCITYDPIQAGSIDGTDTIPHDRAILRALRSTYKPHTSSTDPTRTLFIGRLNKNSREPDLEQAFAEYGKVISVRVVRDFVTGHSKRYGFLEYDSEKACLAAIRALNRQNFQGSEIIVDFECGRVLPGWKPRRLGGGWGGNRNSGQLRFGGRNKPWVKPVQLMNERELGEWRKQGGAGS